MQATRVFFGWLLIVTAPLVLGILEIFHPLITGSAGAFQVLHVDVGWWVMLQLLQITLTVLLFLAVSHTVAGSQGRSVTVSRIGLDISLLFCLAYYGVIGIGTGILAMHLYGLAEAARVCLGPQSSGLEAIVTYSASPIGTGLLVSGSLGWIVGVVAAMRQRDLISS